MTEEQQDPIQRLLSRIENARRRPTGGLDRRYGASITLTREECDALDEIRWERKPYVFRPTGQDEGWVANLTFEEADQIHRRIQTIVDRVNALCHDSSGDDPYYIYEMDSSTAAGIHKILDGAEASPKLEAQATCEACLAVSVNEVTPGEKHR